MALAKVAAKHKGIYISHIRGESFNLFNALDEAIGIGRDAGLPVVIFHLKVGAKANWGRMNEARRPRSSRPTPRGVRGVGDDVSVHRRRHGPGGDAAALGPGGRPREDARAAEGPGDARARAAGDRNQARRLGEPADGRDLRRHPGRVGAAGVRSIDRSASASREIAAERKADPWDVYFQLLIDSGGRIGALYHMMSEEDVTTGLRVAAA